jgi:hypothetical protein
MPVQPRGVPVAAPVPAARGRLRQILALLLVATLAAMTLTIVSPRAAASADTSSGSGGIAAWLSTAIERAGSVVVEAVEALEAVPGKAVPGNAVPGKDERRARDRGLRPRPGPGRFGMNLYQRGDFVSQQTEYWCVVASVHTMINIMEPDKADRGPAFQRQLQFQARRLDTDDDDWYWRRMMGEARWRSGHHGLGLTDWTVLLNARGYGPYEVDRAETRKHAIRKAARAVRLTGKPAGLVVWRGAHAWVMSGFEATADPAWTNQFKVSRVYIQDPWYPAVSSIWGASRPPNAAVPPRALGVDYLRYDRPGRVHPKRDGRYMLILPRVAEATART